MNQLTGYTIRVGLGVIFFKTPINPIFFLLAKELGTRQKPVSWPFTIHISLCTGGCWFTLAMCFARSIHMARLVFPHFLCTITCEIVRVLRIFYSHHMWNYCLGYSAVFSSHHMWNWQNQKWNQQMTTCWKNPNMVPE